MLSRETCYRDPQDARYTVKVDEYASLSEYLDTADKSPGAQGRVERSQRWDLGVSGKEAVRLARVGDPSCVAAYKGLMSRIAEGVAPVSRPGWDRAPAGSRVVVGEYLAGHPLHMRRRSARDRASRHVNVYVSLVCSAGIQASDMIARGAAILALLENLQASGVTCDVAILAETEIGRTRDLIQVIPIESRPLDLSMSGFAIAHPAFTRNVTYGTAQDQGFSGGWCNAYAYGDPKAWETKVRHVLGMGPRDLYVPSVELQDTILRDPERWVRERASQILDRDDQAAE